MYKVTKYKAKHKDSIVWGGAYLEKVRHLTLPQAMDRADQINAMIHFSQSGQPMRSYVATITYT